MKLREIINNIDKSQPKKTDIDSLAVDFDLTYSEVNAEKFFERVKGYYILSRMARHGVEGVMAIFLDDEYIAIHTDNSNQNFYFESEEKAEKLRDYFLHCCISGNCNYQFTNPDEAEFGDYYTVHTYSELIYPYAMLDGHKVKILEPVTSFPASWAEVQVNEGLILKVEVQNLEIPYHLAGNTEFRDA